MNPPEFRKDIQTKNLSPSREIDKFKELVLSEEHHAIADLDGRVRKASDPTFLGQLLPQALSSGHRDASDELAMALQSPLVDAVKLSVNSDRKALSSALFPILGPAIRLYVSDLFRSLIDQLNETIKSATSIRQLHWRIEAKLAGKPFSEYLLLKTLNYRIDNIFMVAPDSGLLLQRVQREEKENDNPELVSGMLVAIRSFVRDSFSEDNDGELGRFSFGDQEIFLETGPRAIIAAVGKGTPPPSFRQQLSEAVEAIHVEAAPQLEHFNGDQETLAFTRPILETLLIENNTKTSGNNNPWPARIFLASAALILLSWFGLKWYHNHRWDSALNLLNSTPGIEVLASQGNGWNRRSIRLLKDPMADEPVEILQRNGYAPDRVELKITPFLSLEEPFAGKRLTEEAERTAHHAAEIKRLRDQVDVANRVLQEKVNQIVQRDEWDSYLKNSFLNHFGVKEGVEMNFDREANLWTISGEAVEPAYSNILKEAGGLLPGKVELSQLKNGTLTEIARLTKEVEAMRIDYVENSSQLTTEGRNQREELHRKLERLNSLYKVQGETDMLMIEVYAVPLGRDSGDLTWTALVRKRLIEEAESIENLGIPEHRIMPHMSRDVPPNPNGWIYIKIGSNTDVISGEIKK